AGGYLAIHDIFPDPADGGQAPYEIYQLALASGLFEPVQMCRTLGVLRRIGH
ncbi:MAG: class I SAM-dependent methyltransferase, partial [Pseudomonadota bacterium]|nr:class I SAM-dependent methyltransferase [Pseudomonadota bacterium]